MRTSPYPAFFSLVLLLGPAAAQTVRVHDAVTIPGHAARGAAGGGSGPVAATASFCGLTAPAFHGQPVPGGGTLAPGAFFNPAVVDDSGRIAFFAQVNGSPRNQGIFVAGPGGLAPIAIGCGGAGGSGAGGAGCGDPTPIGGTFGGFFGGTFFTPAVNDAGDVLFMADVAGGSAPRGLFLFRAASASIVKVAAVGDPSPLGGTFGSVGPGTLGESGEVVFLAAAPATTNSSLFLWNGAVSKLAAIGDPAPGGGTYNLLGTEAVGFADGTFVPVGPIPGINAAGDVVYRAIVTGGVTPRGLVLRQGGVDSWYVKSGDPVPGGGVYFDFQAANVNAAEQIAFFADFMQHGSPTSGWFVGKPGSWRKALAFVDPVAGGKCWGLAFSRNPMTPLDDHGNLLLWTNVQFPNLTEVEHMVRSGNDGSLAVVAKKGDAAPLGGTIGTFDAWPSLNDVGAATVNAATPGAAGGSLSAHMLAASCPPSVLSVTPEFAPKAGGTPITISGTGFLVGGPVVLTIGGLPVPAVASSDSLLTAASPAGPMGPADVVVASAFGLTTLPGGFVLAPAVTTSPSAVAPGATFTLKNWGAPPSAFATWASNVSTSIDLAPFGTLLIGPSPLFDLAPLTLYPAGAPHELPIQMPNDPGLSGLSFPVQSFSLDSIAPLAGTFTNAVVVSVP